MKLQNPRTEDNPFGKDEKDKIAKKREELRNISEYLKSKIERKTHHRKKLSPEKGILEE